MIGCVGVRELLDVSSQRIIRILEVLAIQEGWITLSELSSAVDASERTIAEDISALKRHWGRKLNIESSRKYGVRLLNQNAASIGLVFTDLFNQSVALGWLKELLFHPNNSIEFYENKLFASRSTLIRLLPKMNRFLSDRGMKIQYQNNKYQLLGKDEHYLRDFSASFILELYGLNPQNYDIPIDLKVIQDLFLSALEKNLDPAKLAWIINDDISIAYLIMFYFVSLVREDQGYIVHSDYPVESEIDSQNLSCLQIYFPNLNIDNLRPIHHYIFNQFNGWDSDAEKVLVMREAEAFLTQIFAIIPVLLDEEKLCMLRFFLESLYLKAKFRPYNTSVLFNRIYYFSLSLKRTNQPLYQVLQENTKAFLKNVNLKVTSNTSDVIFWLCLACPELCGFSRKRSALLIYDFGKAHAEFLVKFLSTFFDKGNFDSLQIDIASYPDALTLAMPENYDILITTIPDLPVSNQQIFLINDYPSYNDLCAIYQGVMNNFTHKE